MYKIFSLLFLCFSSLQPLNAQIFPHEGNKLSYRLVGIVFPPQPGAVKYTIEIATGAYDTESSFEKNIITSVSCNKNKKVVEVPSFGCQYTWRIVYVANNNVKTKSALHHFSVKVTPDVDPAITRLRVMKNAEKYKDNYVLVDGARAIYDMNGKPAWFLPGTDLEVNRAATPRDLKTTPQGTITFLTGNEPYEINYNGDILWHYAANKSFPFFHHEFTRLQNGHYMTMIYEDISGRLPVFNDDSTVMDVYDSVGYYRSKLYSSIVEFDKNYHLVWRWSGLEYINNSDMRLRKTVDIPMSLDHDLHENAFFFDEQNKTIYLCFRNISRIIKIKYPEGKVLNTYGTLYKTGTKEMANDLFCYPHCCRRSQNGYLYLYNNNPCSKTHIPKILLMQERPQGKSDLKKIWDYQCTVESPYNTDTAALYFHGGGCIQELPDRSMFVLMAKPYAKIFIVSPDKKILWSAVFEKYNAVKKKWGYAKSYRANIISRKELEKIIWNSQKN